MPRLPRPRPCGLGGRAALSAPRGRAASRRPAWPSAAVFASLRERGRRRDRELRQALAIERVARRLQPGHELAVGEPVLARGGVDAHHPQAAEVALLAAAADERVLERGVDRLFRGAIELALGLVEPFGPAEQLLALRAPYISTFYSRHCFLSSMFMAVVDRSSISVRSGLRKHRAQLLRDRPSTPASSPSDLRLRLARLAGQDVRLERVARA